MHQRLDRRRDERGETLVEVLVSVVILGLVFVVLIGGIATAVVGATTSRKAATLTTTLSSASAAVAAEPYDSCAEPSTYSVGSPSDGYQVEVVSVSYWDGTDTFAPRCTNPDNGLQQLTLRATGSQDGDKPQTLVIVKRRTS